MFSNTKYPIQEVDEYRFIDITANKNDRSTLVFLHGMFGGLSNFEYLIDQLSGYYRIFVPEIPLYNFSKKNLSIPKLSKWLEHILTNHEIKHSILLGNSMGGHIALEYALHNTEKVEALVLSGSSGLFENDFGNSKPRRGDRDYIRERAEMTFYDNSFVDAALVDEILEVVQSTRKLLRLLKLARATHSYNMENLLGEIHHEVLLIWGKNDVITPPEVGESFAEKLPNATLKWIDKCGHAPMMERPERFYEYLKDFLDHKTNLNKKISSHEKEENYSHL